MSSDARSISVAAVDDQAGVRRRGWVTSAGASWLALALGCLVLPFAYGVDNVPCAAWLAPLFLLRFVRTRRLWISMPVLLVVQMTAAAFQMRGMFPGDGMAYWVILVVGAVPTLIPYAIDRAMLRRLSGVAATLFFPLAYAAIDYIGSFSPYGSWGAVGYSQYGELALLQLTAVTGLWGVTFLIGWFAAVGNLIWESGWQSRLGVRAGGLLLFTLALALLRLVLTNFNQLLTPPGVAGSMIAA